MEIKFRVTQAEISRIERGELVLVTREKYLEFLDNAAWRAAYEEAGVDNWSGAGFANELYSEHVDDEEALRSE